MFFCIFSIYPWWPLDNTPRNGLAQGLRNLHARLVGKVAHNDDPLDTSHSSTLASQNFRNDIYRYFFPLYLTSFLLIARKISPWKIPTAPRPIRGSHAVLETARRLVRDRPDRSEVREVIALFVGWPDSRRWSKRDIDYEWAFVVIFVIQEFGFIDWELRGLPEQAKGCRWIDLEAFTLGRWSCESEVTSGWDLRLQLK